MQKPIIEETDDAAEMTMNIGDKIHEIVIKTKMILDVC
jgi:hypothetical protein